MSDLPLELIIGGIGAAIGLALFFVLSQAEDKAVVRDSLRQLDGYEVENVRDQELLNPLTERALKPVLSGLTSLGRRFTPVGYVDTAKLKLIRAGRPGPDAADRFLAIRVVTVALVPVAFIVNYAWNPLNMDGLLHHAVFGLMAGALIAGPDAMLNRKVEERQYELRRTLPDIMDLLVISVEAGLGFEPRAVATATPPRPSRCS